MTPHSSLTLSLLLTLALLAASIPSRAALLGSEDFVGFAGAGLRPGGGGGALDSDLWSVLGFSDGDSAFGDRVTRGDLARGTRVAPARSGGLYAFALPNDRVGLGVQITQSDANPGALLWRVPNWQSTAANDLALSADVWVRDDGARSTRLDVDVALDSAPSRWTPLTELGLVTPVGASGTEWLQSHLTGSVPLLQLAPGDALRIRFRLADAAGTGARDELAFTALRVTGRIDAVVLAQPVGVALLAPLLAVLPWARRARRARGTYRSVTPQTRSVHVVACKLLPVPGAVTPLR